MGEQEGVERLFFELASESRLGLLHELQRKNLKMQEAARRQDMTATEASRQLQRLSEASLIQRQPEGSYAITQYGKVVLQLSSSLEFASKHKEYFLTHDVWRLPTQFVNRIVELSKTNLRMDVMENINKFEQAMREAEQYLWGIGEGRFTESMGTIGNELIHRRVEGKFLTPLPSTITQSFENRTLSDIPALVTITEKEGAICLRSIGGKMDYAGFFGEDSTFLNWARDLFLYYWEKRKR